MARPTRRRSPDPRRPARIRRPAVAGPWRHGPISVIGLVGGIGAGKSLAAAAFERRGAFVIDADRVGHALLDQAPAREQVLARFGPEVLAQPDAGQSDREPPRIDRRALGARVFADPAARRDLEAILHPRMRRTFARAIARTARGGRHRAVVLDAAVLYEAGWDDLCDLVVFLETPREIRAARLAANRGWAPEQLAAREVAQLPLEAKRRRADACLANAAGPDELDEAVGRFWKRWIEPAGRSSRPAGAPSPPPGQRRR